MNHERTPSSTLRLLRSETETAIKTTTENSRSARADHEQAARSMPLSRLVFKLSELADSLDRFSNSNELESLRMRPDKINTRGINDQGTKLNEKNNTEESANKRSKSTKSKNYLFLVK